ncbi:MAG TPA: SAM-dependent methyltransferase [Cyanobacteria bacterium UBA8530]|nr:SAM-dependent methyltransferase [Cyanobacteria bacterium UBA8530]
MQESGCFLCGEELIYGELEKATCAFCRAEFLTQVKCKDGHFVCDGCHQSDALVFLERFISRTPLKDPVAMLKQIFLHPSFKMHGPEHHFAIPAVTLRALENNGVAVPIDYWRLIQSRCSQLPGGTCGYWGACAAGIGPGIAASIFAECNPVKREHYDSIHRITSQALARIADVGGPRCCKRNTVLSLQTLIEAFEVHFGITLPNEPFSCSFSRKNRECLKKGCPFYSGEAK